MLQPTAFAAVPSQQKIDINLPFGAAPGDKVTFSIPNGLGSLTTFSAVVPQPAMAGTPMTKISVTVPVPAALPPGTPLTVSNLSLEKALGGLQRPAGLPPPPQRLVQLTPEQRESQAALQEHRQRVESVMKQAERQDVTLTFDPAPYKAGLCRPRVQQQLGFWRVPRTVMHVPALGQWDADPQATTVLELSTQRFTFAGVSFSFALEAKRVPWKYSLSSAPTTLAAGGKNFGGLDAVGNTISSSGGGGALTALSSNMPVSGWGVEDGSTGIVSGWDAEITPVLRRLPAAEGTVERPPVAMLGVVEWVAGTTTDRWSSWTTIRLAPGEEVAFDLADRRSLGTVCERNEPSHRCKLYLQRDKREAA